ncbi:uncharacterized protein TRIVIDRAFT_119569, partial [Trichoderma virens Gv29-8]
AVQVPFRADEYLIGAPSYTLDAFKIPRLRQCPFDVDSMTWEAQIDGGLDGYVWKVKFGDQGPFVLKVFWDTEPLPYDSMTYHPVQRECHNAALLEMMQESIAQATPELPILVNANPTTREDAWANQVAFSQDRRLLQQQRFSKACIETKSISAMPRMRKCYGWLSISSKVLRTCPRPMRAPPLRIEKLRRQMLSTKDYIAIVYEYVEQGENDHAVVGDVLEFLWLAGFSLTSSPLERNWESGVLLDLCDIVSPRGFGWKKHRYGNRDVSRIL